MSTPRFKVRETYTFGTLKANSDILFPEFRDSKAKKGKYFHDLGTPTIESYLSKNPDRWSPKNIIYFYRTREDGTLDYVGQMTPPAPPMLVHPQGQGELGDKVPQSMPVPLQDGANTEFLMTRIERLEQWLREKDDEIRALYSENSTLRGQLAAAQEEVKKMVEMRAFAEKVEEAALKELEKERRNGGNGLGDPMQLLGVLAQLMSGKGDGSTQPGFQGLNGVPQPYPGQPMPPQPYSGQPPTAPPAAPPRQGGLHVTPSPAQSAAPARKIEYATNVQEG